MPSASRLRGLVAVLTLALASVAGPSGPAVGASSTTVQVGDVTTGAFATPHYFSGVTDDTFYNTVGSDGTIMSTANDSTGVNDSCTARGKDIVILQMRGPDPAHLAISTVNCMDSYGPKGGGKSPDGCSWKSGGITRVGTHDLPRRRTPAARVFVRQAGQRPAAIGRREHHQIGRRRSYLDQSVGRRPAADGAAPRWSNRLGRYRAMFPGDEFSAPFFIQYGPGNTHTVDGGDKYLYAVSTDGYAYNGNYLHLARVPLDKVQQARAWQYYHGVVGGAGHNWTSSPLGATRVVRARQRTEPAGDPVRPCVEALRAAHVLVHARRARLPDARPRLRTRSSTSIPRPSRGVRGQRCSTTPGSAASGVRRVRVR